MNIEGKNEENGNGGWGQTLTITVSCKWEGSQGGSGGNYISVNFCQHSPFPFCRTKVSGAWLIIFKIL